MVSPGCLSDSYVGAGHVCVGATRTVSRCRFELLIVLAKLFSTLVRLFYVHSFDEHAFVASAYLLSATLHMLAISYLLHRPLRWA